MNRLHNRERGCNITLADKQKYCLTHKVDLDASGWEMGWWGGTYNREKMKRGVPRKRIKTKCAYCGTPKEVRPYELKDNNYCNQKCFHKHRIKSTQRLT